MRKLFLKLNKNMENPANVDQHKQKALRVSIYEGGAYGIFDGFGLRYFTPYALYLGVSNAFVGPLITLPQMLGNLGQILTLKFLTNGSRRKKITVTGVGLQASLMLSLILIGWTAHRGWLPPTGIAIALLAGYTLMIMAGTMAGPAWSSWMGDLVPQKFGTYFGRRNQVIGLITILSILSAGIILQFAKRGGWMLWGFILVLFLGFVGRAVSTILLKVQYEPKIKLHKEYYFTIWQFIKKIPQSNFGKFVVYVALMQLAVGVSSPFFAVYMLKELHFNYLQFTFITTTMPFFNMLFMPLWGRYADKFGNLKVIQLTSWCLPFIPWFWAITAFYVQRTWLVILTLFCVEILSGFAWAGFNLSTSNFIYDAVTRQRIAICVTYYNIFNGIGLFIGGLIGGQLASMSRLHPPFSALVLILLTSGVLRFLNVVLFLPKIKEVREVPPFSIEDVQRRLTTLNPFEIFRSLGQKIGNPRI